MSYLGNTPTYTHFESSGEQLSGTGAQTVFTLARRVANAFDLRATISNVVQDPFVAYSVAANTTSGTSDITFTSAPPSAANNIVITYQTGQLNAWETVKAGDILPGAVGTTAIADGAITTAKIADGTVIAADIADGTVSTVKLANSAVTNAKIDTVANTKVTGVMTTAQIADSAVTDVKIADSNVTTAKIADSAVTTAKLAATTGTGAVVLVTSPTLVTPALGTPTALVGTNISGTAASLTAGTVTTNANLTGQVTSVGNAAVLGSFTSAQLATALTDETGSGLAVFATSPNLITPILGTPTSGTLTNCTGLLPTGITGGAFLFSGPTSMGSGSTRTHEGTFTSATGNLSGIHYYTDFTLNSGHTLTVPAGKRRLIIIATGTITINGTINASGAGGAGGAGGTTGGSGSPGTDQPGKSVGGGSGGEVIFHGISFGLSALTGSDNFSITDPLALLGGAGGSGMDDRVSPSYEPGGAGGAGGGSIILIAPTIYLGSTAVLNTAGANGLVGNPASYPQGYGGGGGGGTVYIATRTFTDAGATFTLQDPTYSTARQGHAGIKQIIIY